ncbi:hypothetical protein KKH27_09535 [bacterium]|nr:hypothetical protein [bacterium]MBU1985584.1 hypothetical protein [bacterium]
MTADAECDVRLENVFREYEYRIWEDSLGDCFIRASLPTYLQVFSTELQYQYSIEDSGRLEVEFCSPFRESSEGIVYDSTLVRSEGRLSLSHSAVQTLTNRFHLYRSLGLPSAFAPRECREAVPVTLVIYGRDADSLLFPTTAGFYGALRWLARGNFVYSGLVSFHEEASHFAMQFYVIIVATGLSRHHLFVLHEEYRESGNAIQLTAYAAHLYPFVRTDNLRTLYGTAWQSVVDTLFNPPFPPLYR